MLGGKPIRHFSTTKPIWTAWDQTWVVVGGQGLPDPWHGLHLFWVEIITFVIFRWFIPVVCDYNIKLI